MRYKLALSLSLLLLLPGSHVLAEEAVKKLKVGSVNFDGNQAFSDQRLRRVMLTRPSGFLSRSYYYPEVLDDDLENLILFYQQNGYLEAQVTDTLVSIDSTERSVRIDIRVSEGELTRVQDMGVFGNTVFSDSMLLQKSGIKANDPFRRTRIQEATLTLLTQYANNGYLEAEVKPDVRINAETHRALIDFNIDEKDRFAIAEVRMEGLNKTRPRVVKRELLFRPGQVIRYSRLLESQRRLYLTGLFQSVFIRPQPPASGDSAKKDILIELQESDFTEFNVAAGYGSVEKVRGRIEVFNSNLAGTALKAGLTLRASFIGRGLEASFTEPWTLGLRWKTDLNFLLEYLEEPAFNLTRRGGRLVVGRGFGKRSSASLAYRYEDADLSDVQVSTIPEDIETNLRTLTLSLIYDTRDNLFNSTGGTYAEWRNELAGSFLSGTDTFVRSTARLKYFYRLRRSTIIATALDIGWMDFFGTSKDIPLNERFYAGGPNSLRGFGYQLAGPLDAEGDPIGGRLKVVWNLLEIRQAVYRMIGLAIFADLGNVWTQPEDFRIGDIRTSAGLGLRANTPIGIVRLDYGINLQPKKGELRQRLYFSMGQAF
ncbi:MAG: outer membrane protein assembly factor BamA [candidate division Zixibacteria bacterium]|nr:outer membrane protein assembly factor BamA [candidate division Zixibacteria bacterium]